MSTRVCTTVLTWLAWLLLCSFRPRIEKTCTDLLNACKFEVFQIVLQRFSQRQWWIYTFIDANCRQPKYLNCSHSNIFSLIFFAIDLVTWKHYYLKNAVIMHMAPKCTYLLQCAFGNRQTNLIFVVYQNQLNCVMINCKHDFVVLWGH